MSIHCAFLFPQKQFSLLHESTIGFVSDNIFYRHNFETNTTEVEQNPHGRSYQCMTANHKRGLVVLADYGKNPNIEFRSLYDKNSGENKSEPQSARSISANIIANNFQLNNICKLEINCMELSLDCNYLLVCCGIPEQQIILIDIKKQCKLIGKEDSVINLNRVYVNNENPSQKKLANSVKKIKFNPNNDRVFAIMFEQVIEIYEIFENFVISSVKVEEGVKITKIKQIPLQKNSPSFETMVWDELNNLYISDGHHLFIYSTDLWSQVLQYELQSQSNIEGAASLLLTPKHLIIVYNCGRIEWLNKYYPDAMEEEDPKLRPLYLDKYYKFSNKATVNHAVYNHFYSKIIVSHSNGFYSVVNKQAESNQIDEEDEQNNRKKQENYGGQNKDLKDDLQIKQVGPYFYQNKNKNAKINGVILCRQIKDTSLLLTVSSTGRVIVWSSTQKGPASYLDLDTDLICADMSDDGTVLATANCNGIVQFYSLNNIEQIYLFKEFKLLRQQEADYIKQIAFSSNSKQLACLCPSTKKIYYLLTDSKSQYQVLGYCSIPYTPASMAWHKSQKNSIKPKYEHLLVNISFGIIMINSPAPIAPQLSSSPLNQIPNIDMFACRTDPKQSLIFSLNNSTEIIMSGEDLFFKKYRMPEETITKFSPEAKTPIPAPIQEIQAHDLEAIYAGRGKNGEIITGGKDGTIQIRNADFTGKPEIFGASGWRNGNLVICEGSQTPGLYYSCGKNGIVCFWKTKQLEISLSDKLPAVDSSSTLKKIQSKNENLGHYHVVMQEEYLQKMKDKITNKKKSQLDKIQQIKIELKQLLAENQSHEELQKLARDDFAIDLESRQISLKQGQEKRMKIKQQSQKKVLYDEVYRKKLKQITWDTMQEHLRAINGIKNNYIVFNYQIRKQSKTEKRKLNIIMDLRRMQIKEQKKAKVLDFEYYKNKNVINGGILQPLIFSIFEKKDEKKEEKGKRKKQQEVQKQPEETEEIPNEEIFQLLYSSFELYSDNAKINQIVLMQNVILKIKQIFNKQFNKMMKARQSQNQMINDKNKRIIEICEQLKKANEVIVTKKNILQNPDVLLQVNKNQIPFQRYLSREEREKLEQQRLKQEERLRLLAEDDSSQRALGKMMGGTLEEKKTSLLEVTIDRQKWMDKPIQDMSEEEKIKFKEYEQKKQKAEEEKERMVKKLQAELRKLKHQIDQLMQKYDQKLFNLLKRRIQYDLRIQEQELYCIKLSQSIINVSEETRNHAQIQERHKNFQNRHQLLEDYRDQLRQYQEKLESLKGQKRAALDSKKQADLQTKIKTVEKSIFEQYNNNLKKRREMEQRILQSGDIIAKNQIIPLDPMREIESRLLSQRNSQLFKFFLPQIKNLQQTYQFPDSLINVLQNRFNLKKEEQQIESKLKSMKLTLNTIQRDLQQEQETNQKQIEDLEKIQSYLKQQKSDLQVQCRIKKGQVQINEEVPVPKLDDALLIHKSQIDQKNANIIEKAKLKIDVMGQIKTCKIRVTEDTLNLERKQALIDELCGMIKQVQMLKVKKQMQTALAKKDTRINQNQLRSLKEQIEKVRRQGQKRMSLLNKKIEKVGQQIETIKRENKQLQVQKWNLDNTVKQREKIKQMMVGENGGGNQEAAEKFDQISINRKLFDKAKQQTEEIQLLRQQLSKLKAKTFANFSNVQR